MEKPEIRIVVYLEEKVNDEYKMRGGKVILTTYNREYADKLFADVTPWASAWERKALFWRKFFRQR